MKNKKILLIIVLVILLIVSLVMMKLTKVKDTKEPIENKVELKTNTVELPNEVVTSLPVNLDEEGLEIEGFEESSGEFIVSSTNIDVEPYKNRASLDAPVYFSQTDPRWGSIMYSSCR